MEQTAYIGTYTGTGSTGIYRIGFDGGKVCLCGTVRAENPSYLLKNGDMLYAVREMRGGGASSYRIQSDGSLVLTGTQEVLGDAPCHLCLDEPFLYVSNYTSGALAEFLLDAQGTVGQPPRLIVHTGNSIHPTRQTKPHVHFSCVTPGKTYLAVCDLGLDEVLFYPRTGAGIAEPGDPVHVPLGSGPRHALFGRKDIWYVVCELSCELFVYRGYGKTTELVQRFSTLRMQDQEGSCAALRMSSDGKLLLASVRGANTLALFDIRADGLLDAPRFYDSYGNWPRDAVFTPCGQYVLCACERDNCLTIFSLVDGTLKYLDAFALPSPACICFA